MAKYDLEIDNLDTYNAAVNDYKRYELNPPERVVLSLLKNNWHNFRMLDIGVGAGRTSYTFSSIVKDYVGIDYSPPMIAECKRLFQGEEKLRFEVCDAADMSRYYSDKFDFILFSCNGIDSVDHGTRIKILSEVKKVLKEDGYFYFSSHSIKQFPIMPEIYPINPKDLVRSTYLHIRTFLFFLRLKRFYRHLDFEKIREKDWDILITGDHNFKMKVFHVSPRYQVKQLEEEGYIVKSVYDKNGQKVDPETTDVGGMMYFLCQMA